MIIPIYNLTLLPEMTYTFNVKNMTLPELNKFVNTDERMVALPLKKKNFYTCW